MVSWPRPGGERAPSCGGPAYRVRIGWPHPTTTTPLPPDGTLETCCRLCNRRLFYQKAILTASTLCSNLLWTHCSRNRWSSCS
jgi:hypothetical protein